MNIPCTTRRRTGRGWRRRAGALAQLWSALANHTYLDGVDRLLVDAAIGEIVA